LLGFHKSPRNWTGEIKRLRSVFYAVELTVARGLIGQESGPNTSLEIGMVFTNALFFIVFCGLKRLTESRERRRGIPFYPQRWMTGCITLDAQE
jgi:hypothetical protein